MNASEAKQITDTYQTKVNPEKLKDVYFRVKIEAAIGNYQLDYQGLTESEVKELRENGYSVGVDIFGKRTIKWDI